MGKIKKKFKIDGMHCTSCALSIDMDLEDLEGVQSSKTSYAKQSAEIEFDEEKVEEKEIKEVIEKLGYKVVS
ncbi:MAG: cation transporter [Patescibacteria group bacterium]|nr:cation transporter [Patescibacteria group bacterium]